MKRDTLHLTLAFLGEVDDARFALACAIADELAASGEPQSQLLTIDRLAFWKHNHIVWAGSDAVPPALAALADALATGLREAGFVLDSRRFAAHVTLLRNARCTGELPAIDSFDWPVANFVLVESHLAPEGAHYEIVRRWPLPGSSARIGPS